MPIHLAHTRGYGSLAGASVTLEFSGLSARDARDRPHTLHQFGIFTWPPTKVISAFDGGESAIGGTLAAVIGGAPTPRGVVWTTWLGGNARPCRKWSYIRSIAWMK